MNTNKCKNCGNDITKENFKIYCSYNCRNIYVNKNIRDYTSVSYYYKQKYEDKYYLNPKKCIHCNNNIPYEKRRNNFCNSSCSATHTNKYNKGIKHNIGVVGLNNIIQSNKNIAKEKYYDKKIKYYYFNKKRCKCCNKIISYIDRINVFCNIKCKKEYFQKILPLVKQYKSKTKFRFSLNSYPNEFDFSLIEKYGWYKASNNGNNLMGISRDHMVSVMWGFKNNINPYIIAHPANCKLMIHSDNISKLDDCSITIEELMERIKIWNEKYK